MSGEELAAALYAEQGYVVLAVNRHCRIGEILPGTTECDTGKPMTTPLRIIGPSSEMEYRTQIATADRLIGQSTREVVILDLRCFYRVVAAD